MADLRDVPTDSNPHAATRSLTHGTGSATSDDSEAHRAYDTRYPPRLHVPDDLTRDAFDNGDGGPAGLHIRGNRRGW